MKNAIDRTSTRSVLFTHSGPSEQFARAVDCSAARTALALPIRQRLAVPQASRRHRRQRRQLPAMAGRLDLAACSAYGSALRIDTHRPGRASLIDIEVAP